MRKTMELCKVRQGETFTLDGVDFVKLDDCGGAAFALTRDVVLKNIQFEKEDTDRESHNNYCGSNLDNSVYRWITDGHNAIYSVSIIRDIDLTTMDGMTDYGCPTVFSRVLTIDEYRKYRRFIPLTDTPYWLATGYSTGDSPLSNAYYAYRVDHVGTVHDNRVDAYFAARPAFYLKPYVLVSAHDGEDEPVLADFSDTDLLDELCRRIYDRERSSTAGREKGDER